MKYGVILVAIALLMPASVAAQANSKITTKSDVDVRLEKQTMLKDMHNLYVVVMPGDEEETSSLDIDLNILSSIVFVAIKRDLPIVKVSNGHSGDNLYNEPLLGMMYVEVSCVSDPNISACWVEIKLERAVRLISEDATHYVGNMQMTTVWSRNAKFLGGTCPMHKRVEDSVSEMMVKFAADWYEQNPTAVMPPPGDTVK
jgi:hypothetical protein